ncbi:MAG: ADP-ribosylglycohydrolase family protein [Bacteroidota bacterium]
MILDLHTRVLGMLYGTAIGDAAGGPVEFMEPSLGKSIWKPDTQLSAQYIQALHSRFQLRESMREAEPLGYWIANAPAGTITDDTRFKLILIQAFRQEGKINRASIARAILNFTYPLSASLAETWLSEFREAAHWALGEGGLPPDRMWGGIESLAGQLIFLPIAALHPGQPADAYLHAWSANIFDTGIAKDLNSAAIAGLSVALVGGDWPEIRQQMITVDPYKFGQALYGERPLQKWLHLAEEIVAQAKKRPAILFDLMETHLQAQVWWEAWVPLVVMFACIDMVDGHPLAAMQLALEFGHDTDSNLQLMGAFIGAMYGPEIFPLDMRHKVQQQLQIQYGEDLENWVSVLLNLSN